MGAAEVTQFLTHLAAEHDVPASTQNQALSALLFFVLDGVRGEIAVAGRGPTRDASHQIAGSAHQSGGESCA